MHAGRLSASRSGGVYIFIGANAETRVAPARRSPSTARGLRSRRSRRNPRRVMAARSATPTCSRRAFPGVFACGDVRFRSRETGRRRRRRGEHGDRVHPPVPARRAALRHTRLGELSWLSQGGPPPSAAGPLRAVPTAPTEHLARGGMSAQESRMSPGPRRRVHLARTGRPRISPIGLRPCSRLRSVPRRR